MLWNILKPFKDLPRLCYLFNCLTPFQILGTTGFSEEVNAQGHIAALKASSGNSNNNTFQVDPDKSHEQMVNIREHQHVEWSLASEKNPCSVTVEFRANGSKNQPYVIFKNERIAIENRLLQGQFETQKSGTLVIRIDNSKSKNGRILWYQVKTTNLTPSRLFEKIFQMHFNDHARQLREVDNKRFSQLVDMAFEFIGKLIDGTLLLSDMSELNTMFSSKDINIKQEVRKLLGNPTKQFNSDTSRPGGLAAATNMREIPCTANEHDIEQVCQWLRIYQYFSYINDVANCLTKFSILSEADRTVAELKRVSGKTDSSLKRIANTYKILEDKFQALTGQHLQLIKTVLERSDVVKIIKDKDLYSEHGQHRFQELRDNLTTQFQLQEKNNMILNSLIVTYTLIKPFVSEATNFDEFVARLAKLTQLDANSLNHIEGKTLS